MDENTKTINEVSSKFLIVFPVRFLVLYLGSLFSPTKKTVKINNATENIRILVILFFISK